MFARALHHLALDADWRVFLPAGRASTWSFPVSRSASRSVFAHSRCSTAECVAAVTLVPFAGGGSLAKPETCRRGQPGIHGRCEREHRGSRCRSRCRTPPVVTLKSTAVSCPRERRPVLSFIQSRDMRFTDFFVFALPC